MRTSLRLSSLVCALAFGLFGCDSNDDEKTPTPGTNDQKVSALTLEDYAPLCAQIKNSLQSEAFVSNAHVVKCHWDSFEIEDATCTDVTSPCLEEGPGDGDFDFQCSSEELSELKSLCADTTVQEVIDCVKDYAQTFHDLADGLDCNSVDSLRSDWEAGFEACRDIANRCPIFELD